MIIAFIGDIGSGKTLSMVKFMLEKYNKGNNIYPNFGLKFPKNKSAKVTYLDMEFFRNYSKSGLNLLNSVIAIDECHVFFDSRNSMLKRNKIFSKFVTQSRKRSVDLVYTTQDKSPELFLRSGQVDLRLRKLTDYIIFCKPVKQGRNVFIINSFCDKYGLMVRQNVFFANDYFKYYDTNEIIDFDETSI